MTDTLAQVQAHIARLREKDPELADALSAVVERIEAMDPKVACREWREMTEQRKAMAQKEQKER